MNTDVLVKLVIIFIVSFLPITEVRGGIPLAVAWFSNDSTMLVAGVLTAVAGNMLIAPFVLYLLKYIDRFIRSSKIVPATLRSAYIKVLDYVQKKSKRFENYEATALALFVGVPLPATGAWTGSLIAFLLGMDRRKALIAVELGVLIASIIVFAASYAGIAILKKIFYLQ